MRTLALVGRQHSDVLQFARRCAWCRRWESTEDYVAAHRDGARVSHGMCDSCAADFTRNPTPPAAA